METAAPGPVVDQSSPTAATSLPAVTATSARTPAPVKTPTPTPTVTPPPFECSDPRLVELQEEGYVQVPLERFAVLSPTNPSAFFLDNQGRLAMRAGGPVHDEGDPPDRLSVSTREGQTYTYLQYCSEDRENYHLLFTRAEGSEHELIADVDASTLSERIGARRMGSIDLSVPMPLFCLPYEWGDFNGNGRPDIAVTLVWANNYTGGEVHIFEVKDDGTVTWLTRGLPGPMSHWDFDPSATLQLVIDDAWAVHDCLYPGSPFSFWIYAWDDRSGAFVDVTSSGRYNLTDTEYAAMLREPLTDQAAFQPRGHIGLLVSLLLLYDKEGQREAGWQEFMKLADERNWPGSDEAALDWLRADVAHFGQEYEAEAPFTPNDYGCQE